MRISLHLSLVNLCLAVLAGAVPGQNKVHYVDAANGLDTNPGTFQMPLKTISAAVGRTSNGDTVKVLPGTYKEIFSVYTDINIEGHPGATIEAVTTGRPMISVNNLPGNEVIEVGIRGLTFDGTQIGGGIGISTGTVVFGNGYGAKCRFEGNHFKDCWIGIWGGFGLETQTVRTEIWNNTFENTVDCTPAPRTGLHLQPGSNATVTYDIRGNKFYDLKVGIEISGSFSGTVDADIFCNVFSRNSQGIHIARAQDVWIVNNTVAFTKPRPSSYSPIGIENVVGNTRIRNCILWNPPTVDCSSTPVTPQDAVDRTMSGTFLQGNNLLYTVTPTRDPKFVNSGQRNYRLQSSSPAIAGGLNSDILNHGNPPIGWDADLNSRLLDPFRDGNIVVDLGAYEYTDVDLQLTSGYNNQSFVGVPVGLAKLGAPMTLTVQGAQMGDAVYLLMDAPNDSLVMTWPNLGIQLVGFATLIPLVNSGSSMTYTLAIPNDINLIELQLDFQGLLIDPLSVSPYKGAYTRRARLEITE